MATRSRRSFRARPRQKQNVTWATPAIGGTTAVAEAATTSQNLLENADWDALLTFERVTLLRIVGWVSVSTTISTATTSLFGALFKQADAVAVPDPRLSASYDSNDTLLSFGCQLPATASNNGFSHLIPIDVTVKRRLDTEDAIVLALRAGQVGTTVQVAWFLRALWAMSKT